MVASYKTLILAHGIVMAVAVLWFIPIAVMAAKYFRPVQIGNNKLGPTLAPAWKVTHALSMIMATALIIAGFTLGYYAAGNSFQTGTMNAHFIIGLTFFIGILIQALAGPAMTIFYHARESKRRPLLNYVHITFGYLISLLGISNIWLGLQQYGSPRYLYILWIVAVAAWFVIYVVAFPLRKVYEHRRLRSGRLIKQESL